MTASLSFQSRLNAQLLRLMDVLEKSDTGEEKYKTASECINLLANAMLSVEAQDVVYEPPKESTPEPYTEPPFPVEQEPVVVTAEPVVHKYTKDHSPTVRKALADARKNGVDIAAVMKRYGATNFGEVDPMDYDGLMKDLGAD